MTGAEDIRQEEAFHLAHLLAPMVVLLQGGLYLFPDLVNLAGYFPADLANCFLSLLELAGNVQEFLPGFGRNILILLTAPGFDFDETLAKQDNTFHLVFIGIRHDWLSVFLHVFIVNLCQGTREMAKKLIRLFMN
jgi:hypothetical protein